MGSCSLSSGPSSLPLEPSNPVFADCMLFAPSGTQRFSGVPHAPNRPTSDVDAVKIIGFQRPHDAEARLGVVSNRESTSDTQSDLDVFDLTDVVTGVVNPLDAMLFLQDNGLTALEGPLRHAPRVEVTFEQLLAPIAKPGKFLAIGYNYRRHASESGVEVADYPLFFNKQVTCVSGPRSTIIYPRASAMLDYEGELAFVIARRCHNVSIDDAPRAIGAWMACNDVSARDWQRQSQSITLGKSYDSFGPIGPWLLTPDEVADPHDLRITTTVNGVIRQDGSTSDMIHNAFEQIVALSARCTLEPGDIITTGSPAGSAQGQDPSPWLEPGDLVRVDVEHVGVLENLVVVEDDESFEGEHWSLARGLAQGSSL